VQVFVTVLDGLKMDETIVAYRELALAIFLRAMQDLPRDDSHAQSARRFLASPWAAFLAESMGLAPGCVSRLAEACVPASRLRADRL
jgi:predicted benzoate:H+ symporter BenE